MEKVLAFLSENNGALILTVVLILIVVGVIVLLVRAIVRMIVAMYDERHKEDNKEILRAVNYENLQSTSEKANVIRQMLAPNGVDTAPNSYLVIDDGGRDVYVRTFTISKLPKRTRFANTFVDMMDFPNCTSSVFVEPIGEGVMNKKLNKHITVTDSEFISAQGDPNRQRKLSGQYRESMQWAQELERGDNKFFNVGFLFSIYADSVIELNNRSDTFRSLAVKKGIEISSCFAAQAEAYVANAPLNNEMSTKGLLNSNCIKYIPMDKYSVSTIYNYTQSTFSHKTGVPIGTDLFTKKPVIFDIYNHKSFIGIVYGPMGYGKSATIKMICDRLSLADYRFAAVDSQTLKGTNGGEYNPIARLLNGVVFQLSSDTDNVINPFEIRTCKHWVKDAENSLSGYEATWLDLNSTISLAVDNILTIIQGTRVIQEAEKFVRIKKLIEDSVKSIFDKRGIEHGKPDSLYVESTHLGSSLTSGRVMKTLPTLTDFYMEVLMSQAENDDTTLVPTYNLVLDGLSDYIRELYYSKSTLRFFTRDEYEKLPIDAKERTKKVYLNNGQPEEVIRVRGTSPYFDGQSTIDATEECPFINIDISQLKEGHKKIVARQIAISWINECVINKNSEDIKAAERLLVIFDEAHENFAYEYGRNAIEKIVRTARKRNTGMFILTQTISEFDNYKETQAIRDLASFHFIFAQPYSEKDILKERFGFTDSQINTIINYIGSGGSTDPEEIKRHVGEMCIFDKEQKQCAFVKVAYFKQNEAFSVETKAEEVQNLYQIREM